MKILIIDDHHLFREGLKLVLFQLNPDIVPLEAAALDEALALARQHTDIAIVLFDLGLPGVQGIDALTAFRQQCDDLPVIVLSGQEDQQTVLDALAGGAMGFVPKSTSPQTLHAALKIVLDNGVYVPPVALGPLRPSAATPAPACAARLGRRLGDLGLTGRQAEVFRLIVQGKTNKAIARTLQISESTIKQHVKPILRALGVTSRVGAILEVARLGISLEP